MRKKTLKITQRCTAFLLGLTLVPLAVFAQDWYEATGKPVARSLLNSADLRTEFALIESNIADKLPALTGNGSKIIAVNSAGTALEALSSGVPLTAGGTGATTAAGARTNLGLAIGSDVQAWDAGLEAIAALAVTDGNFLVGNGSAWVAESGATARTSLGLGSLATLSSINNGNWSGVDLAITNGGTGASEATAARSNLGLSIGSDVQAFDADLSALAALAKADGNFIVGNGSAWVAESGSTARSSLGLGSLATASSINNGNWSGTDLAIANGGTGASDASTARSNLGLGSLATASSINNANWSGTDLAVTNGGTGASDAVTARSNLGAAGLAANTFSGTQTVQSSDPIICLVEDDTTDTAVFARVAGALLNFYAVTGTTCTTTGADLFMQVTYSGGAVTSINLIADEVVVNGGGALAHSNVANDGGKVIITDTAPSDTTGMVPGDIKLVY